MIDEPIVRVEGVAKSFGSTRALAGVDIDVSRGTVVGLLGRNGAGKTTLVRIVATLVAPDAGRVHVAGMDVVRRSRAVRSLIGLAGQFSAVDDSLTGRENLQLVGRLYGLDRSHARVRADQTLERLSLTHIADQLVRTYSGGMRRRLDLGASLVGRPLVLLMDEPTSGLDPSTRMELWTHIRELVRDGTTVLLTTQYLEEADRLADSIVVIERGRVAATGTPDQLKELIGLDVLEVRARGSRDVERLVRLLDGLGAGPPLADLRENRVTLPTVGRVQTLLAVARRIEASGLDVHDLGVRRPSLDDVFLRLTQPVAEKRPEALCARP